MSRRIRLAAAVLVAFLSAAVLAESAAAGARTRKKISVCKLLTTAQISDVVGVDVGAPAARGKGLCQQDVQGETDRGVPDALVVFLYRGGAARLNYQNAQSGEKVGAGDVYFASRSGTATGAKKGTVVSVSISMHGVEGADYRDEAVGLVQTALTRV